MKKILWSLLLLSAIVSADDFTTKVIKVHDGDTFTVQMTDEFTHKPLSVRINHIDAPEYGGRAKCSSEKVNAQLAKTFLESLILDKEVVLHDVSKDKYGRLLATVTVDSVDVGKSLLEKHLVIGYEGKKKQSWCNI
ncbi:MAG: thermonuclease family protein [Flavobacterium sp.]|uniref:thermonuclease family protein n=1 Tax=Flavobacterium sp. TaxID=239 RepID=UPI00262329A6|nr:thermonuclease family protein [Flavobacterium sp.]MDD5150169.1 thermonuclease family protein [Flavobacterium sp.]